MTRPGFTGVSTSPTSAESRRCSWADSHPLLRDYHDNEYGVRKDQGSELLEQLLLEMFRS